MSHNTKKRYKIDVKATSVPNEERYQIQSFHDFNFSNLKNVIRYNPYSWMLIALIIVSFVLRFVCLDFNSLWLDEAFTADYAKYSISEIWMKSMSGGDVNPPLFYWLEHMMLVFGNSEFILRFLPALFGSLTIPVVYFIGKEINGKLCGIISAGLLAFSTYHIYFSQEARAYTTMIFLFSLAVLFYLIALKAGKWIYWILAGVFSALAVWAHFFVFIGIISLFIHSLIVKKHVILHQIKMYLPVLSMFITAAVLCLPILINALDAFSSKTSGGSIWGYDSVSLLSGVFLNCSGGTVFHVAFFIILFIIGLVYLFLRKELRNFAWMVLLSIVIPLITGVFLSSVMPMDPRYLIFIIPFYFAAIGSAFYFIPKRVDYKKIAAVVLVIACVISIPFFTTYYLGYFKEDWRSAASLIADETNDGDYVVAVPSYLNLPFDYYYERLADNTIECGVNTVDDLEKINKEHGSSTVYYYMTDDIYAVDSSGKIIDWLFEKTTLLAQGAGIYLFVSK